MYKNLHIPLLMLAAAAMIIAGCKKKEYSRDTLTDSTISDRTYGGSHDEDVAFPEEPEEVNFFSNSDTWSQNDCIGIYMVETGTYIMRLKTYTYGASTGIDIDESSVPNEII